jgi:hypothetical protein
MTRTGPAWRAVAIPDGPFRQAASVVRAARTNPRHETRRRGATPSSALPSAMPWHADACFSRPQATRSLRVGPPPGLSSPRPPAAGR